MEKSINLSIEPFAETDLSIYAPIMKRAFDEDTRRLNKCGFNVVRIDEPKKKSGGMYILEKPCKGVAQ